MRLIDADALKVQIHSRCDVCNDKDTAWCEHCCSVNDWEDYIDNAPTITPDKAEYYHLDNMPDDKCIVKFKEGTCGACHHLIFRDYRHNEGLCNLTRLHRCFYDKCVHEEESNE